MRANIYETKEPHLDKLAYFFVLCIFEERLGMRFFVSSRLVGVLLSPAGPFYPEDIDTGRRVIFFTFVKL